MRRTPWRATRVLSKSKVSVVVPRGTGTPKARKLTALPMCASATSKVALSARKAAFSGNRVSVRPPAVTLAVTRGQATSKCIATSRYSVGLRLKPERA